MSKNEPFAPWQCPLCGEKLTGDSTLKCTKGHCFDRAKEGYWHLLPVQSMRTKAPGDSKEMVAARRAFLNAGYYGIFGRALGELCLEYGLPAAPDAPLHLLDAGCGEGWYDRCIAQAFAEKGSRVQLAAVKGGYDLAMSEPEHRGAYRVKDKDLIRMLSRSLDQKDPWILLSRPTDWDEKLVEQSFGERASERRARKTAYILLAAGVVTVLYPSLICICVSFLMLIWLFLFKRKDMVREMQKKFRA